MSPGTTEAISEAVGEAHDALRRALEGMDYCLDWRPQPGEWSAREIVAHLLGRGRALDAFVEGSLRSEAALGPLPEGEAVVAPDRRAQEMPELLAELELLTQQAARLLANRQQRPQPWARGTLADMVASEYREHWPEHIRQLSKIRDGLGL